MTMDRIAYYVMLVAVGLNVAVIIRGVMLVRRLRRSIRRVEEAHDQLIASLAEMNQLQQSGHAALAYITNVIGSRPLPGSHRPKQTGPLDT